MEGVNPKDSKSRVLGIDIDIRSHNRDAIESHPLNFKIDMLEGSSTSNNIIQKVYEYSKNFKKILLLLDSNHSHEHVINELNAYSKLVTVNSYCIVYDTCVENLDEGTITNRPWGKNNNPMTAVKEWLPNHPSFVIDQEIEHKLMITVAPSGYLKKIK